MSAKLDLANSAKNYASDIMALAKKMDALNELYFDSGFNSGGSDAIQDSDIANADMTAAELGDFINFCSQFNALLNNQAPFQADWSVNLNKIRIVNIIG